MKSSMAPILALALRHRPRKKKGWSTGAKVMTGVVGLVGINFLIGWPVDAPTAWLVAKKVAIKVGGGAIGLFRKKPVP